MKTSVFIGIPCYGDVKVGTADSLFLLAQTLAGNQIASKLMWAKSPYVGKCRNMLVSAFLKSGAEYLLFIDADVEFYPEAVMKMINSKKTNNLAPLPKPNKMRTNICSYASCIHQNAQRISIIYYYKF
jgi:hypothetical protein